VLFSGIKAAVVIIVFQALYKLSRRALKGVLAFTFALAAFVAIFFFLVPFPAIIATAALLGFLLAPRGAEPTESISAPVSSIATMRIMLIWGAIWAAPLGLLWILEADLLMQIGLFFSKLAVVTFGGAYAVLAYMTQEIVQAHGWLSTSQMIDALGLAETTPGPLILVTQFAGFMTGFLQGGPWLGVAAALVTLWVTFVPCFLWIFAAAPYVEAILARPRLAGAFDAISASVVGVILNLAVWFTLHVLFTDVPHGAFGPALALDSFDFRNALLVVMAAAVYLVLRLGMVTGLAVMAVLAWVVDLVA
ncbi:MAG: chromate transporter, partial [Roseovarius sp.]